MDYSTRTPQVPILKFWSNAKEQAGFEKSNFFSAPFTLRRSHIDTQAAVLFTKANPDWLSWIPANGVDFVSSEHCWQSLKATNQRTFNRFTATGDLSRFTPDSFKPFLKLNKTDKSDPQKVVKACDQSFKIWSPKRSIGIIAKQAANPKYRIGCGFGTADMQYNREIFSPEIEMAIWKVILTQKFAQNLTLKQNLLNTRGMYLLEFDRGAAQEGKKVHWGGYITPEGQLLGENVMGIYVMQIRDAF